MKISGYPNWKNILDVARLFCKLTFHSLSFSKIFTDFEKFVEFSQNDWIILV